MSNQTKKTSTIETVRYTATDSKGNVHDVRTNFLGEKVRDIWTPGRFMIALFIFIPAAGYIRDQTDNIFLVIAGFALVAIAIRTFVMQTKISEEELKTLKPKE